MLSNAVGSELIKLRAYRLTYWLLPLALVFLVTAAAFGFDSVRLSAAEAAPQSVLIDSAAYAFGLGSPLSGLVLGVFAALIVTADQGSGTIYQSLLVLSRRTVVLAKVLASGAAAALITAVGTFAIAAVELPDEGLVVLGQVPSDVSTEDLTVGMEMELVIDTLYADDEGTKVIWKWRPVATTTPAASEMTEAGR